jgi:hypothetical protein
MRTTFSPPSTEESAAEILDSQRAEGERRFDVVWGVVKLASHHKNLRSAAACQRTGNSLGFRVWVSECRV